MKHSEWTTAISTSRTDLDFLRELKSCSIDGIELSVPEWEVNSIAWAELKENAGLSGVSLLSYHLPFGDKSDISSASESAREQAVEWLCSLIDKACGIGIKRFVIHPSYEPIADSERGERIAQAKKSLADLAKHARTYGAVICVENLPRTCLGHDIAEMKLLLSADEDLRVCFDVNHLLLQYGDTHRDFIAELGEKTVTAHFSDYDFIDEKHYFCGNGDINWDELIGLLENVCYGGPFLFEGGFAPHRVHTEVPYGKYSDARQRQLEIRAFKGKNH